MPVVPQAGGLACAPCEAGATTASRREHSSGTWTDPILTSRMKRNGTQETTKPLARDQGRIAEALAGAAEREHKFD